MRDFKKYKVWHSGVDIAVDLYKSTEGFPSEEKFGLTSQIRRCGVSIASNIAEGAGRNTDKEFHYFLGISSGSCAELYTQLYIAHELKFLSTDEFETLDTQEMECQKMINGLQQKIKADR